MSEAWEKEYLARQQAINDYAHTHGIVPDSSDSLPARNPCEECTQRSWCDRICYVRARWWDAAMEKIRRALGI